MEKKSQSYNIDIEIDDYVFTAIEEDIEEAKEDGDNELVEDYTNDFAFLKSIENGTTVSTLAEYFELLERISSAWDEYRIFNEGTYISIGEG